MAAMTGTTGSTLSFDQIQQLWISNGGNPAWAPTMAGIAIAESGGMTNNLNNNASTGDFSVGLWQINYFGNLGPSRSQKYGNPVGLANDPNAQAKAAVDLLGGGPGITAWAGDTVGQIAQNGKPLSLSQVKAVLPQAATQGATAITRADGTVDQALAAAGSATTTGVNPLDPLGVGAAVDSVPAFLGKVTNLGWWKRAALVGLGIGFVGVGLVVFFEGTDTGQKITKDAVDVAGLAAVA